MSVINKPDLKIFAQDAKTGEFETFPDILRGWGITLDRTAGKPPLEWFNAVGKRVDEWLMYLTQRGVAEWDTTLSYPKTAIVQFNSVVYVSIKETKGEQPDKSQAAWSTLGMYLGLGNYQLKGDYATNAALNDGLNTKFNTSDVLQEAGTSTTSVMSQKAVTDALKKCLAKDQNGADIPDKGMFMENLGLGDAAKRSVGISTNQIPDMSSFTASLSGSGWQKLPGGLIIQWGSYTSTANSTKQYNFPIAFPLACVSISITRHQPGSNEAINGSPVSRTAFAVQDYATGNEVFSMMAIGY